MAKKVMSKDELLANKEQLVADYRARHQRNQKKPLLTKKERKVLDVDRDRGYAQAKFIRINAFKVNAVLKLIRGKMLTEALAILMYTPGAVSPVLIKLLKSAEANAVNNNNLSRDDLYVAECYANQGPTLKRFRARARGGASRIWKRTSHITVVLREKA
ncbi:MAG TPA: 50S ribosomal protein L22 [Clostridiaceae bacterium]|nr:50S ribosomal protein L22 [Clostridiaceae bacterium]